jgi:N-acetylmuramoyl-L-alanine amidase
VAAMSKYLIALDDGHGMETAGKRSPKLSDGTVMRENEFNKTVISKLDIILKRCGFYTLLTAPTDADTSLSQRSALANTKKATILVSVHANALDGSFDGPNPKGVETYYYPGSVKGKKLAETVHKYLIQGTKQIDRGVKAQNLHMIRETDMPAILVEAGFMDSPEEIKLLLNDDFRNEVAEEIAKGICEYLDVKYVTEEKEDVIYRLQVGAYSNRDNAVAARTRLKSLGYDAIIVTDKK